MHEEEVLGKTGTCSRAGTRFGWFASYANTQAGRIVVDRPGNRLYIVDQAIVPELRGRGIGTAIMRSLMDEAAALGVPVTLQVASSNDPSMRLYLRLGFVPIRYHFRSIRRFLYRRWRDLLGQ